MCSLFKQISQWQEGRTPASFLRCKLKYQHLSDRVREGRNPRGKWPPRAEDPDEWTCSWVPMFSRKAYSWGGTGCPNCSTHLPPGLNDQWGGDQLLRIKATVHVIFKLAKWPFIMSGLITLSTWIQVLQKMDQPFGLRHENRSPTDSSSTGPWQRTSKCSLSLHLLSLSLSDNPPLSEKSSLNMKKFSPTTQNG